MRLHYNNVNPNKLHDDLINNGVNPILVENDVESMESWITFAEGTDMELVQQIIDAHDPTPLPPKSTEIELLRLEQAKASAELFEMMLMLTGGGS